MKTTYYIAIHTKCKCDQEAYTHEAGKMANAFQQVFGDRSKLEAITKPHTITQCHAEVEVSIDSAGLVGKCVVDIEAPVRIQLDKSKLSALFKATTDWPGMRIEKRAVQSPETVEGLGEGEGQ